MAFSVPWIDIVGYEPALNVHKRYQFKRAYKATIMMLPMVFDSQLRGTTPADYGAATSEKELISVGIKKPRSADYTPNTETLALKFLQINYTQRRASRSQATTSFGRLLPS
jgi:hypothetical protein